MLFDVQKSLNDLQIFPGRYFYPSLNKVNYVHISKLEISESIASRILCLPLSDFIEESSLIQICTLINKKIC